MNDRLLAFFQSEIEAECAGDFPRLGPVPDTTVQRNIQFFKTLDGAERAEFVECLALLAYANHRFVVDAPAVDHKGHPFFNRWREATLGYMGDEFIGIPILRAMVAQYKTDLARGKESTVRPELVQYAASMESVKAPVLRKAVKGAFEALNCTDVEKFEGGVYIYHCTVDGKPVQVWIDYAGSYAQLRYHVALPGFASYPFNCFRLETALGFGFGDWNTVTVDNLAPSLQLLCQFVEYAATLPDRIRESCQ